MASTKIARSTSEISTQERVVTWANYENFITDLHVHKNELTEPKNNDLSARLKTCDVLFEKVRTPREGVLDAIALKTISAFARIQTVAIDNKATTEDAFKLIRKCAKIIKNNLNNSDDVFADFYTDFCHCHKLTGTFSLMSGRLPTYWFEKQWEKSILKEKTRRTREVFDLSQRTPIVRIKKMSSNGEQTSKEIIHIYQSLQKAYKNNANKPLGFFLFTIHPTLFSRSVENIFHVSFLIKEGKAELFLDENQLPVLRPLHTQKTANNSMNDEDEDDDDDSMENESNRIPSSSLTQLVLSLDMEQWEILVHVFDIQMAMIEDK